MRDCEATSAGHCHCSVDAPQQNGSRPCRGETPAPTANLIQALPAHLGWDNSRYTQIVREKTVTRDVDGSTHTDTATAVADPQPEKQSPSDEPHLHIFGHVLDRLQQDGLEGAGRVWLLLRFLDRQQGQGRVSLKLARHMLTSKQSAYRCLSWKRLRQVLNEGEGIFWHRDKKRWHVYYHSEVRVAQALGLAAIRGWAVKIPVRALCGSITAVRAVFYDAFHSSRGDGFNKPITRYIMNQRGNGDSRTQRKYERIRGMKHQSSFATVGKYDRLAWRRAQAQDDAGEQTERVGGPAFIYVDYKGILGQNPSRKKRPISQQHWHNIYIMRQIGNAYQGTLPTVKRGRRWTNLKLKHLCNSMQPTGSFAAEETSTTSERMYYGTPTAAQKAVERGRERPSYWPRGEAQGASGYWQEEEVPWSAMLSDAASMGGGKKI